MAKEAVRPAGSLSVTPDQTEWTPEQLIALDQLGLHEASEADKKILLHQAQKTGLDPLSRQIYMMIRPAKVKKKVHGKSVEVYENKCTVQATIDGLRIVAERHGQYGGQVGPEWCGEDGKWQDVWISRKPPVAARVGIIRKDWTQPVYGVAMFSEYAGNQPSFMYQTRGAGMLAKCAEALGLRKTFPQDLSGVYTAEEMTQADQTNPPKVLQEPQLQIDWDAELEVRAGDRDALSELWRQARDVEPNNLELIERIAAAGKAAAAGVDTTAEPIDAEIVAEPGSQSPAGEPAATPAGLVLS